MNPEDFDRPPLVIAPTHITGLIEFTRADCRYCRGDLCSECVTFASRSELEVALKAAESRDVPIGHVWLDWQDVKSLLTALDGYDAQMKRRAS